MFGFASSSLLSVVCLLAMCRECSALLRIEPTLLAEVVCCACAGMRRVPLLAACDRRSRWRRRTPRMDLRLRHTAARGSLQSDSTHADEIAMAGVSACAHPTRRARRGGSGEESHSGPPSCSCSEGMAANARASWVDSDAACERSTRRGSVRLRRPQARGRSGARPKEAATASTLRAAVALLHLAPLRPRLRRLQAESTAEQRSRVAASAASER